MGVGTKNKFLRKFPDPIFFDQHPLLWALFFLAICPTEEIATAVCDCDEKTHQKWVNIFVTAISFLEHQVVSHPPHSSPVLHLDRKC